MDIIYILIPLSILLIIGAITVLFWAIKGGQFDDMDSPAHKILFDDDEHLNSSPAARNTDTDKSTPSRPHD